MALGKNLKTDYQAYYYAPSKVIKSLRAPIWCFLRSLLAVSAAATEC